MALPIWNGIANLKWHCQFEMALPELKWHYQSWNGIAWVEVTFPDLKWQKSEVCKWSQKFKFPADLNALGQDPVF
jgi:hypothetical protein